MVDMKANPFFLSDEDCKWVEDTIAGMSLDEKIGQLFFNMGSSRDEEYLKMTVNKYHIGGIRYNPGPADEIHEQNRILQENSKIPLIIACNTENGGDGACVDGTTIGSQTKIGATRNVQYAYNLGYMSNKEAAAIGCNLSFAPVSRAIRSTQSKMSAAGIHTSKTFFFIHNHSFIDSKPAAVVHPRRRIQLPNPPL